MKRIFYYIYGRPLYQLCIGFLVFSGMWAMAKQRFSQKQWLLINRVATAAYCLIILYYTLLMRSPAGESQLQLIPFYSLIHSTYIMGFLQSMWLNIALFVPLGIFLGNCFSKSVKAMGSRCVVICMCFSLFIECTQWVAQLGQAETDDVVLNTLGGIIGFGLVKLYCYLFERKGGYSEQFSVNYYTNL